ncbi:response regulator [Hymenobacter sp. GOD-10R]|uniref:response regulator n=1 Tax=Hymenobacter sp. GOD-10R TaxID=3093922 RepID=UPI002D76A814|nr:response regulator [Hymenobacter sp. GOD-10R]WRQ26798.1 response regulator [Hymenobacter sp. GOD-10R]
MPKLPCILLVDDDQTTNFLNQLLLKKLGVAEQVLVAQDGQAALDILNQQGDSPVCPVLILLDVNMPGMNGIQFLEAYQQMSLAQHQAIVIIMLTTSLHPRDVERVQRLSIVTDFISKPLTAEKMQAILQNHF